jgi:NhaP-type Na+/H+ or K+/H+ antiporter
VLYAVVGTFVSSIFVGLALYGLSQGHASYAMSLAECLAFGSLISSTDPVRFLLDSVVSRVG